MMTDESSEKSDPKDESAQKTKSAELKTNGEHTTHRHRASSVSLTSLEVVEEMAEDEAVEDETTE